jgi:hypothetical protein
MKVISNNEFLRDFANLLLRYGPEPFLEIARILSDSEKIKVLTQDLIKLANTSKEIQENTNTSVTKPTRKRSETDRISSLISEISKSDTNKADLLSEFFEGLKSRHLLKSKNDILEFCSVLQIEVSPNSERNKMIFPIIRHIANLPFQEATSALDRVQIMSRGIGEEYSDLAKAIMKEHYGSQENPDDRLKNDGTKE